jgi:predicted RNase H-like HicB family nuclease
MALVNAGHPKPTSVLVITRRMVRVALFTALFPLPRPARLWFYARCRTRGLTAGFDRHNLSRMKSFTAVVEKCQDTGLYVAYVPGFPGAHSQGASLDEVKRNLEEVITMLLEDGEPALETEFVGTQTIQVG